MMVERLRIGGRRARIIEVFLSFSNFAVNVAIGVCLLAFSIFSSFLLHSPAGPS